MNSAPCDAREQLGFNSRVSILGFLKVESGAEETIVKTLGSRQLCRRRPDTIVIASLV